MGISVGFIGAGQMGMPMVRRLHGAGIAVTVLARRPEVADELRALGISVTDNVCELASKVDVVEVCLFSDLQLREVFLDGGAATAMSPGSILMSHVTGSPTLCTELADAVGPKVSVLDAPISGTAAQIDRGDLTVLLGGDASAVARVTPILESFASHIIHAGSLGDGQRVKLVNNLLFAVNLRIAGEAIRIGAAMGLEQSQLVRAISQCSGRTWALGLLEEHPFAMFEQSARRYLDKDIAAIEQVAGQLDLDLGLLGTIGRGGPIVAERSAR
jgi:3-hydroxyisobutyrate dehydrogenase-like beta-hydroxyacid dehydrogenase